MAELSRQRRVADIESVLELVPKSRSGLARRWRSALVAAALIVAGGIGLLLYAGTSREAVRYVTAPVARGDLTVVVTATGSVEPTNMVDVSSELSGTLRKVLVDFNSRVVAGQALAELDTDNLRASVASARARLTAARARVREAAATVVEKERDLERKQALAERQVSSQQDLDLARAAYDRAVAGLASTEAEVGVAKADLEFNETNLAKACICSPIDGIVLRRNADPGQTVASSLQAPVLFTIAEDLRQMEIQVDVDEADVGKVGEGQSASFSVDAHPDRHFPARVRELRFASEIVQGVVTYMAVLTVDNSDLLLRPGMTATAEITVDQVAGALLVPNAALRFSPPAPSRAPSGSFLRRLLPGPPQFRPSSPHERVGPERTVWILRGGVPVAVAVVVGATDGKRTEIVEGDLVEGQAVILDTASSGG